MTSKHVGVWELQSDTRQALMIFTDTHYSYNGARKGRQRIEADELSLEEAAKVLDDFGALAGAYTVSGSTFTLNRFVTQSPNMIGLDNVLDINIDGDTMTARGVSGGHQGDWVFKRVG